MKRILLIEDNPSQGKETKRVIEELPYMFKVNLVYFSFMTQNGDRRETQRTKIMNHIEKEIKNDSFDILMIDMLLGGDSTDDPLGLEIIKSLVHQLDQKTIIVYTEMASRRLDLVKEYNQSIDNKLIIVPKPNSFVNLSQTDICEQKYKESRESHGKNCNLTSCDSKTKLQCAMECIYYSI